MHELAAIAAWVTVTVCPATFTEVIRLAPPLLLTPTVALPGPVPPPVAVAHDEPDTVQAQPLAVDTATVAEPAAAPKASAVGETV